MEKLKDNKTAPSFKFEPQNEIWLVAFKITETPSCLWEFLPYPFLNENDAANGARKVLEGFTRRRRTPRLDTDGLPTTDFEITELQCKPELTAVWNLTGNSPKHLIRA
jgi:hypothetical protein